VTLDFDALLNEVYESESARLVRLAFCLGVPQGQVEDVVQETWLAAVTNPARFQGGDPKRLLQAWLTQVLRNKAVDALRHLNGERGRQSLEGGGLDPVDQIEAECAEAAQLWDCLAELLAKARLDNEDNPRLLCEHYLQKRSIKELSVERHVTEKAVRCRIDRLVQKLREWLGDEA
jgi:RNA polymerase sigma factor (sigma-70 family)